MKDIINRKIGRNFEYWELFDVWGKYGCGGKEHGYSYGDGYGEGYRYGYRSGLIYGYNNGNGGSRII
jgi:hypothetical protein